MATLALFGLWLSAPRAHAEPAASQRAAKQLPVEGRPARQQQATRLRVSTLKLVHAADSNRDGRVSQLELERFVERQVLAQVERRMHRLDRNHDGHVAPSEVPSMAASRFQRFDLNGDGKLTTWELAQVMRQLAAKRSRVVFAKLDADRDGALSLADIAPSERLAQVVKGE